MKDTGWRWRRVGMHLNTPHTYTCKQYIYVHSCVCACVFLFLFFFLARNRKYKNIWCSERAEKLLKHCQTSHWKRNRKLLMTFQQYHVESEAEKPQLRNHSFFLTVALSVWQMCTIHRANSLATRSGLEHLNSRTGDRCLRVDSFPFF